MKNNFAMSRLHRRKHTWCRPASGQRHYLGTVSSYTTLYGFNWSCSDGWASTLSSDASATDARPASLAFYRYTRLIGRGHRR